jgi:hypothetical protein
MDDRNKALSALGEAEADLAKLLEIHGRLNKASRELGRLFAQQSALIGDVVESKGSRAELSKAIESMQETQMSFNLQYLQLQSQMQHENRSYTAVSNIMKTKHDTVKNSISNIR